MNTPSTSPSVQDRFNALLISTELANRLVGKRVPGMVTYEESEQGDARRRFLHVEKLAIKQKATDAKAAAAKIKAASNELHKRVVEVLKPQFTNGRTLTTNILGYNDDVPQLLDVLSTRACSVSRLEPILCGLPWLQDSLIKAVNSPEYRRIDSKGRPVVIESVRTALSAMGIENLRVTLPFYIAKHAMPQVTDPYPQIKAKLEDYQLAIANSMMRLARLQNFPQMEAFTLGLFSGLGMCAAIRQYFREYDKTLQAYGKELLKNRDFDTYKALQLVEPSAIDLIELCEHFGNKLTTRVLEYMLFKRLRLLQPWTETEHPLHATLTTAREYAKLKVLLRYRLIEKDQARFYLKGLNIDTASLAELNKPGIFKLAVDHSFDQILRNGKANTRTIA
jgi:hypothetical protein